MLICVVGYEIRTLILNGIFVSNTRIKYRHSYYTCKICIGKVSRKYLLNFGHFHVSYILEIIYFKNIRVYLYPCSYPYLVSVFWSLK